MTNCIMELYIEKCCGGYPTNRETSLKLLVDCIADGGFGVVF